MNNTGDSKIARFTYLIRDILFLQELGYSIVNIIFWYLTGTDLKKQWFLHVGVLAMLTGTVHQLLAVRPHAKLYGFVFVGYILALLMSIVVPLFFDSNYRNLSVYSLKIFLLYKP